MWQNREDRNTLSSLEASWPFFQDKCLFSPHLQKIFPFALSLVPFVSFRPSLWVLACQPLPLQSLDSVIFSRALSIWQHPADSASLQTIWPGRRGGLSADPRVESNSSSIMRMEASLPTRLFSQPRESRSRGATCAWCLPPPQSLFLDVPGSLFGRSVLRQTWSRELSGGPVASLAGEVHRSPLACRVCYGLGGVPDWRRGPGVWEHRLESQFPLGVSLLLCALIMDKVR